MLCMASTGNMYIGLAGIVRPAQALQLPPASHDVARQDIDMDLQEAQASSMCRQTSARLCKSPRLESRPVAMQCTQPKRVTGTVLLVQVCEP